jgi:hypothetical protein
MYSNIYWSRCPGIATAVVLAYASNPHLMQQLQLSRKHPPCAEVKCCPSLLRFLPFSSLPCLYFPSSFKSRPASSSASRRRRCRSVRTRRPPLQSHFVSVGAAELRSASSSLILSRPARTRHSSNPPVLFDSPTYARAREQMTTNDGQVEGEAAFGYFAPARIVRSMVVQQVPYCYQVWWWPMQCGRLFAWVVADRWARR